MFCVLSTIIGLKKEVAGEEPICMNMYSWRKGQVVGCKILSVTKHLVEITTWYSLDKSATEYPKEAR